MKRVLYFKNTLSAAFLLIVCLICYVVIRGTEDTKSALATARQQADALRSTQDIAQRNLSVSQANAVTIKQLIVVEQQQAKVINALSRQLLSLGVTPVAIAPGEVLPSVPTVPEPVQQPPPVAPSTGPRQPSPQPPVQPSPKPSSQPPPQPSPSPCTVTVRLPGQTICV